MQLFDRLTYALIGFLFGAVIGVACWWLYGVGMSRHHLGHGVDPMLRHWVQFVGLGFSAIGFLFREQVGDAIGNAIGAIFQWESERYTTRGSVALATALLVGVVLAAWWFAPR